MPGTAPQAAPPLAQVQAEAYRAIFQRAGVGMAQADPFTGALIEVNPRMVAMLGWPAHELVGRSFLDFTHADDRTWNWEGFQAMVRGDIPCLDIEKRFVRADGSPMWVLMSVTLLRDAQGRPLRTAAVMMDITDRKRTEAALADSEQRLQLALHASGLGLWEWDLRSGRLRLSSELLHLLGLQGEAEEVDILALRRVVHPEDVEAMWAWEAAAMEGRPFETEYRVLLPGGRQRWVVHHSRTVCDDTGRPQRVIGTLADVSERRGTEEALRQARDALETRVVERTEALERTNTTLQVEVAERRAIEQQVRELLGQLVVAEEEERRRISRELHDGVGQHLTALSLGLKAACDDEGMSPALRERLSRLQAAVRHLDDEIDRLSHELRPNVLDDLGLEEALQEHVAAWAEASGIAAECHVHGLQQVRLPVAVEAAVYRIVQEALTNVRKHAQAQRVAVLAERRGHLLRAIVEDDGRGFEPELPEPRVPLRRRLGLRGMSERAALIGGRLEIESRPGAGTTIYLSVPLPPDHARAFSPKDDR